MGLSKQRIKYIRSLKEKKYRKEHATFVAEGTKLVLDLLATCRCQFIAAQPAILKAHPDINAEEIAEADESELKRASFLKTAPQAIAVFYQPHPQIDQIDTDHQLTLLLDGVQDPGNVGAIVRIADWFGIENIICSPDSADLYNPKTVQATMGAIARVKVHYTDIPTFLKSHSHLPAYGTFLQGVDLQDEPLSTNGFIVMGSEGKGISPETEKLVNRRIYIPSYPPGRDTSESLNVATATAIVCAEFRRREQKKSPV